MGAAFLVAALIGVLNAVLPPVLAAIRLPFMLVTGFLLVLVADAFLLIIARELLPDFVHVGDFGDALLASLLIAAVSMVLQVLLGTNDDDEYTVRVTRRIARRLGAHEGTDVPGIIYLEIDGLALPMLRAAMRDGSAPNMANWIADDGYRLAEWETDLSSQTGASQAGILLGSNEDIPAFRWVEKENGRMLVCSSPSDCAEIESRHATGIGLLINGGASRGNLLSGEAEDVILTVSRTEAERKANPGYRAFLANGFNVTRALVLFLWEIGLEVSASMRANRRDVRPRGHRGGIYPLLRAAMCVIVRDLIVFGVLTDMMRGRPAVYATFSSYDEVAHHSGLMRADTLEALRKLDQQFGRLADARRYAPRPYEIVVLSDHGQTQGATFKQRNGYGLEELVERSLDQERVAGFAGGDEQEAMVGHAVGEATGRKQEKRPKNDVSDREVVVLGSGNLGLVYLMESQQRLTREEIDEHHPRADPGAARPPAHRLAARALGRARRRGARTGGRAPPRVRPGRGRGPAGPVLAHGGDPPPALEPLPARRRPHDRELLRPGPGRGLRVRGADQLPRRARRPADPALHPVSAGAPRSPPSRSSVPPRSTRCSRAGGRRCRARPPARQPAPVAARRQRTAPLTGTTPEISVPLPGEETIARCPWTAPRRSSMLRRPSPVWVAGDVEAGAVVADLEAQLAVLGAEVSGDVRGRSGVLGRVLQRLQAAVVDRRFDLGGVAADAPARDLDVPRAAPPDGAQGGHEPAVGEHAGEDAVGELAQLLDRAVDVALELPEAGAGDGVGGGLLAGDRQSDAQ